jgi:hypothetical protein
MPPIHDEMTSVVVDLASRERKITTIMCDESGDDLLHCENHLVGGDSSTGSAIHSCCNVSTVEILPSGTMNTWKGNGSGDSSGVERSQLSSKEARRRRKSRRSSIAMLYVYFFVLCCLSCKPSRQASELQEGSVAPLFKLNMSTLTVVHASDTTANPRENDNDAKGKLNRTLRKDVKPTDSRETLVKPKPKLGMGAIFHRAAKKGLGGGIPGAMAGAVQVLTLMWIRTIINYQYRYGTTFRQAFKTLRNQGGIRRFYQGVGFALIQNPLSKFGSTAANDGLAVILKNLQSTSSWGHGRRTMVGSIVVGIWRVILMPVDTCKTVLQVDSTEGFKDLMRKVRAGKVHILYEGAVANAIASAFSFYPWFYMYNRLSNSERVAKWVQSPLVRNAMIGFLSSLVSDTVTNFLRVIKTTKQAMGRKHSVGYGETISMILAADGVKVSCIQELREVIHCFLHAPPL